MSTGHHRIQKIHSSLNHNHKTSRHLREAGIRSVPAKSRSAMVENQPQACPLCSLEVIHVVIQRKPLRSFPMPQWVKMALRGCYAFMRWVNQNYGFAASDDGETPKTDFHNIEIKVAHPNETDAWHDANCEGGAVKRVPWRAPLSDETCQFGAELWPALDGRTQRQYQDRKLEIISFTRSEWESLEAKAEQLIGRPASA